MSSKLLPGFMKDCPQRMAWVTPAAAAFRGQRHRADMKAASLSNLRTQQMSQMEGVSHPQAAGLSQASRSAAMQQAQP